PVAGMVGQNTDSLVAALEGQAQDTHRVNILTQLADQVGKKSIPQALKYAHEAQDLSTRLNFTKGIYASAIDLAQLYRDQNDIDNILKYAFIAMEIAQKENRRDRLATTYNVIANGYTYNDEHELAQEYLKKCRSIALEIGDTSIAATAAFNIGNSYLFQERFAEALPIFKENLPLFERDDYFLAVAISHNNIGRCYFGLGQYETAQESYKVAYDMKVKLGNPKSLLATRQNIGEALTAQKKYQAAEELLLATLSTADSLGVPTSKMEGYQHLANNFVAQGRFEEALAFNEKFINLKDSLQREKNDSYGKMLRESITFKDQEIEIERLEREQEAQEARDQIQQVIIWGAAVAILIFVILMIVLVRSNQNRKKANEALTRLNREKDGLLGMVAHDLKAPLNSTLGIIDLLKGQGLSAQQDQLLSMAEKSCSKGVNLIGDLLELNKIEGSAEPVELKELDLGTFLKEKRTTYGAQANQKQIVIKIEENGVLGSVQTSTDYLDRVLDNLISNAIKFSPRGSEIRLKAGKRKDAFYIAVSDNGPGFTEEDKKKMYASFQQLSAKPTAGENSTGLGLAIVKSLVAKLKGNITLDSAPGKGATFTVELPSV
ncbi:MAG: tetratricopeptide repeat-containing sensor histidine kinase, partial [Bacteroidota bacterium]